MDTSMQSPLKIKKHFEQLVILLFKNNLIKTDITPSILALVSWFLIMTFNFNF